MQGKVILPLSGSLFFLFCPQVKLYLNMARTEIFIKVRKVEFNDREKHFIHILLVLIYLSDLLLF